MSQDPFLVVKPGESIFKEGDAGTEMFIIESGTVEILRADRGKEPLAVLEAGDFFGEMAVLEDQPRFASAFAQTECRLLRIDRAHFADVLRENVEIAIRIMRKMTARQRRSDLRAAEAHAALDAFKKKLAAKEKEPRPEAPKAEPTKPKDPPAAAPAPAPAPPAPAKPSGIFKLHHADSKQDFELTGHTEYLVGRPDPVTGINPEINLGPLDAGRSLSRRHAKVLSNPDGYFVREEVGTANGTFVNGERLQPGTPVKINPGDKLRFGSVEVQFDAA
jgi:hypothetical protein